MSKRFIEITSGWIPVSVLLLCAAALIAEQARANLPNETKAAPVPAASTSVSFILTRDALRQFESVPPIVDTILALPAEIEFSVQTKMVPRVDDVERTSEHRAQ